MAFPERIWNRSLSWRKLFDINPISCSGFWTADFTSYFLTIFFLHVFTFALFSLSFLLHFEIPKNFLPSFPLIICNTSSPFFFFWLFLGFISYSFGFHLLFSFSFSSLYQLLFPRLPAAIATGIGSDLDGVWRVAMAAFGR